MLGHGSFDESEYEIQTIRDNVELITPELLRDERKRLKRRRARGRDGTASRNTSTDRCAPPERRVPENRPTAEPAPKPRKTDADAQMSALAAETAPFPRKNALPKTPGKPVIRKIRAFSVGH